ncbi:MAG: helix-turn-helix domain-containing protein [Acidobacteriota bacterium]|jgi:DNA-binding transcriptional ArsR family regulator
MQDQVQLVDAARTAAAMLHPVRSRLLEEFREPRSAAEVARALDLPRQRIGHHVRVLRDSGLLEKAGERRRGNFVEKLLQTSARVYVIAPQALGALGRDPEALRDRFSSEYLVASATRTIRDLTALRRHAADSGKKLATITLETEVRFAGPEQQAAFAQELGDALISLTAKYHDEDADGGRRFRFSVGGYPATSPADTLPPDQEGRNG